jgi:hypothetical protein
VGALKTVTSGPDCSLAQAVARSNKVKARIISLFMMRFVFLLKNQTKLIG